MIFLKPPSQPLIVPVKLQRDLDSLLRVNRGNGNSNNGRSDAVVNVVVEVRARDVDLDGVQVALPAVPKDKGVVCANVLGRLGAKFVVGRVGCESARVLSVVLLVGESLLGELQ